jgi:hypothetical protein
VAEGAITAGVEAVQPATRTNTATAATHLTLTSILKVFIRHSPGGVDCDKSADPRKAPKNDIHITSPTNRGAHSCSATPRSPDRFLYYVFNNSRDAMHILTPYPSGVE